MKFADGLHTSIKKKKYIYADTTLKMQLMKIVDHLYFVIHIQLFYRLMHLHLFISYFLSLKY